MSQWKSAYAQQGDVLIKKVGSKYAEDFLKHWDEIPKKAKKLKTKILYQGKDHQHYLETGSFEILKFEETIFLKVKKDTKISHKEHKSFKIPKGSYFIDLVNEYDHAREEQRKVID